MELPGPTMKKILDDAKPEAAYFGERDGNAAAF